MFQAYPTPNEGDGHEDGNTAAVGGSVDDVGLVTLSLNELHSRAKTINHIFGGLANVSQRVIFTHGRLDPWRAVGMQRGQNVLFLEGLYIVYSRGGGGYGTTFEFHETYFEF